MGESQIEEIKRVLGERKEEIEKRLEEFRLVLEKNDPNEFFAEFAFCLLTPQSKAKTCWAAIEKLKASGILYRGSRAVIEKHLVGVRFKRNKAGYIVEAREKFLKNGKFIVLETVSSLPPVKAREWLVRNVKGMGMKEASHFLRNIGLGENLAILDRHILKNLKALGVIDDIPSHLSISKYLEIEGKMREFSSRTNIPMSHLDLVLWCRETGEIFK